MTFALDTDWNLLFSPEETEYADFIAAAGRGDGVSFEELDLSAYPRKEALFAWYRLLHGQNKGDLVPQIADRILEAQLRHEPVQQALARYLNAADALSQREPADMPLYTPTMATVGEADEALTDYPLPYPRYAAWFDESQRALHARIEADPDYQLATDQYNDLADALPTLDTIDLSLLLDLNVAIPDDLAEAWALPAESPLWMSPDEGHLKMAMSAALFAGESKDHLYASAICFIPLAGMIGITSLLLIMVGLSALGITAIAGSTLMMISFAIGALGVIVPAYLLRPKALDPEDPMLARRFIQWFDGE